MEYVIGLKLSLAVAGFFGGYWILHRGYIANLFILTHERSQIRVSLS
jgi:hypothetical protein